ncbi:MAG: hypothetical protein KGL15_03540 [Acidobacteriota bacterium]|nr:hypothetical protein [Acidobacteriota bacterium]
MRLRLIGALVAVVVMATAAAAAFAAKPATSTCAGGLIGAGTYQGLTVTGTCFFDNVTSQDPTITIDGNLTIAPGASLNAHAGTTASVTVTGNVLVGQGGTLGLGSYGGPTGTVVDGNIVADQPQSLYLAFLTIHGNLVSQGGTAAGPFTNFPIKNLTVGGNVTLEGWSGFWIGLFRSTVGGNVFFANNTGTNPDSSEVANNTISGNLICSGNNPAVQFGDSGGGPNTVGGHAVGQCAAFAQTP